MQPQINIVGRWLAAAENKGAKPKGTAGVNPRPTMYRKARANKILHHKTRLKISLPSGEGGTSPARVTDEGSEQSERAIYAK
ncbi:MAG: hypothetical protein E7577_06175 [Ruminococcaceae bacterium]|nr:hypothetical protein [Oscillospiraceae bacterium]